MKYASLAVRDGRQEYVDIKGVDYPLNLSSAYVQHSAGEYEKFVCSQAWEQR